MKELRSNDTDFNIEDRTVTGYALNFGTRSNDLGGFVETIAEGSLDGVLEQSDILCLMNHDENRGVLARSKKGKGTLELTVDEKGLKYRFEAPNTEIGNELLEGLKRGDISASSFAFRIANDKWDKLPDGRYLRTITKFKELYDVSPVYRPAYDSTSVSIDARGLKEFKEKENELKEYYSKLREQI